MMFSEHRHQHYRTHGENYPSAMTAPKVFSHPSLRACPVQAYNLPNMNSASTESYAAMWYDIKPQLDHKLSGTTIGTLPPVSPILGNGSLPLATNSGVTIDNKR